jgi:hypothetical protein
MPARTINLQTENQRIRIISHIAQEGRQNRKEKDAD